ncbi:MAG: hypothetical protein M1832_000680 [Thelocarpon impressellum]|nr:MAG: hypothetical protein M1832_000680 [Thelocarpon impressellum]
MSAPQEGHPPTGQQQATGQKDDYLDKGVGAILKKQGQDPNKHKALTEKITDKARGFFEKATGKKVPEKFSN